MLKTITRSLRRILNMPFWCQIITKKSLAMLHEEFHAGSERVIVIEK